MAELVLKIGTVAPDPAYQDGDVLCALNRRRIRCCHAEHICHFKKAPRNASGLILTTSVTRDWYEATHQYRFERVSASEIERVTIATGQRERISSTPNAKGEAMDVRLYVARRKAEGIHFMLGEDGREFWYGGIIDFSHAKLDVVWSAIESKTPHREVNFKRWPAGSQELKSYLFIAVDEFDDIIAEELVASDVDSTDPANPVMTQKRLKKIDWKIKLGLDAATITKILDKQQDHDHREVIEFKRNQVIDTKPKKPR